MKILITSGGTRIPIDPVRSITNHGTGKLGSEIAKAGLLAGADIIYLTSFEGKTPFSELFDFYSSHSPEESILRLKKLYEFSQQYRDHYIEYRYKNYIDYSVLLKKIIDDKKPDVVILTAAVSDYLIENDSSEKIRSTENLSLQLKLAPKLIDQIKQWLPTTFLVGFKLLINGSDSELVEAGLQSIARNKADVIVGNNLSSLQKGAHEILIIEKDGSYKKIKNYLAEAIIARVERA